MTAYFYHLKFELYPTATPNSNEGDASKADPSNVWLPSQDASAFDDFPSHSRTSGSNLQADPTHSRSRQAPAGLADAGPETSDAGHGVIDCGPTRVPLRTQRPRVEEIADRRSLERHDSFPPPPAGVALKPDTAVRDWRFGRVSVESIDSACGSNMATAGGSSRAEPSAAPTLGPTFGGAGTSTKAEFQPLETRHTELGWGVVHFYREGEGVPEFQRLQEGVKVENESDESDEKQEADVDCSTLCIPAVPAYMSPGDFLGFVGERWRGDISHCRMVMTSSMNRYLVLLKLRDSKKANEWRRQFGGKVFNAMEVSF